MLTFQNPGLIDPLAITTLGASIKEGDNPIGFFGTGLKYAIAATLRLSGTITIYRGLERFDFTAEPRLIRNTPFSLICMNGEPLGFTTDFGKLWEPWKILRELHCNAKDEGGWTAEGLTAPHPDMTTIHVISTAVDAAWRDRHLYFLESNPIAVFPGLELHPGGGDALFYRNVNIGKLPCPSVLTPNIFAKITLTEDRTIANYWDFAILYCRSIVTATDEPLIETILTAGPKTLEGRFDFTFAGGAPSDVFLSVANRLRLQGKLVNDSARRLLINAGFDTEYKPYIPQRFESDELASAISIATALGFPIADYPVEIVDNLGEGIYGRAKNSTIYISRFAFEQGLNCLLATLIEEHTHLKLGYADCTRELQDYFLRTMIRFGRMTLGAAQ